MTVNETESVIEFYLDLERRLSEVLEIIPFLDNNRTTTVPRLASIITDAGSMIDSVLRNLIPRDRPKQKLDIIAFAKHYEPLYNLSSHRTLLYKYPPTLLTPFRTWAVSSFDKTSIPPWWNTYNKLKHERPTSLMMSTLDNAVLSLCALHQLIAILPDFLESIVRHDMIISDMAKPALVNDLRIGKVPPYPVVVETELFVTALNPYRFPENIKDIAGHEYYYAPSEKLKRFLAIEIRDWDSWDKPKTPD